MLSHLSTADGPKSRRLPTLERMTDPGRRPLNHGDGKEALLGAEGEAVAWRGEDGRVRIRGEIWRARASKPLKPGTRVKVVDRDGLVLIVESA